MKRHTSGRLKKKINTTTPTSCSILLLSREPSVQSLISALAVSWCNICNEIRTKEGKIKVSYWIPFLSLTLPLVVPRSDVDTIVSTCLEPILALRVACLQWGTNPYTTWRQPLNKDTSSTGAYGEEKKVTYFRVKKKKKNWKRVELPNLR